MKREREITHKLITYKIRDTEKESRTTNIWKIGINKKYKWNF